MFCRDFLQYRIFNRDIWSLKNSSFSKPVLLYLAFTGIITIESYNKYIYNFYIKILELHHMRYRIIESVVYFFPFGLFIINNF